MTVLGCYPALVTLPNFGLISKEKEGFCMVRCFDKLGTVWPCFLNGIQEVSGSIPLGSTNHSTS